MLWAGKQKTRPKVRAGLGPERLAGFGGSDLHSHFPAVPKFKFQFRVRKIGKSATVFLNRCLFPKESGRDILNGALLFPPLKPFGERLEDLGLRYPENFRNLAAILDAICGDDMEDKSAHFQSMLTGLEVATAVEGTGSCVGTVNFVERFVPAFATAGCVFTREFDDHLFHVFCYLVFCCWRSGPFRSREVVCGSCESGFCGQACCFKGELVVVWIRRSHGDPYAGRVGCSSGFD